MTFRNITSGKEVERAKRWWQACGGTVWGNRCSAGLLLSFRVWQHVDSVTEDLRTVFLSFLLPCQPLWFLSRLYRQHPLVLTSICGFDSVKNIFSFLQKLAKGMQYYAQLHNKQRSYDKILLFWSLNSTVDCFTLPVPCRFNQVFAHNMTLLFTYYCEGNRHWLTKAVFIW